MSGIEKNILNIRSEIADATKKHSKKPVILVAISKAQPIEKIKLALKTGQKHFGESYLQEALGKIKELNKDEIIWHYIGRIQSKKARLIAQNFDWVQSVSSFEKAKLLNGHRPPQMSPLNICIQVNISEQESKSGILLNEVLVLAEKICSELPKLKLRGLMAIPAFAQDREQQLAVFKKLKSEFENLQEHEIPADTLSMGMSHDFKVAIEAGATMVRIGSAIFGERKK